MADSSVMLKREEEKTALIDLNNRLEVLVKELGPFYQETSETRRETILELEETIAKLMQQGASANEQIETLRQTLDDVCQQKDAVGLESRKKDSIIDALNDQLSELQERLDAVAERADTCEEKKNQAEQDLEESRSEVEQLVEERDRAVKALEKARGASKGNGKDVAALTRERDALQDELAALKEELDNTQQASDEKDAELFEVQGELAEAKRNALKLRQQTEGALARAKETGELADGLQNKLAALRSELLDITDKFESAKKEIVDQKNHIQTLDENAEYLKKELDLKNEALQNLTVRVKELVVTSQRKVRRDYNEEIAQALAELREQYEIEAESFRLEMRLLYEAQLRDLKLQLDKAQLEAEEAIAERDAALESAEAAEQEASTFENRLRTEQERSTQERASHLEEMQRRQETIADLEAEILDLQRRLKDAKKGGKAKPAPSQRNVLLEKQLEEQRHEYQVQCEKYRDLMGEKLALDREIELYKKWLAQGEEIVFGKAANSPWQRRKRAHEDDGEEAEYEVVEERRVKRARKAKEGVDEGTSEGGAFNTRSELEGIEASTTTTGFVHIDTLDLDGLFVKLTNMMGHSVNLKDWTVESINHDGTIDSFEFPEYDLPVAAAVTIWSSKSPEDQHGDDDIVWDNLETFHVSPGSSIRLLDEHGVLISQTDLLAAQPHGEGQQLFSTSSATKSEKRRSWWNPFS